MTLAPLNHLQNLKSSVPDTVNFMEIQVGMFQLIMPKKLWILLVGLLELNLALFGRNKGDIK